MDFVLPLLAILSLSLYFNQRFRLASAAAPMFSIALITVFLCLLGMMNLLVVGSYLVYAAAIAALLYVFLIKKYPLKEILSGFVTPGLVFFVAGSIFFLYILYIKNASFRDWDEFSSWGTMAKFIFMKDQLFTFFPASIKLSSPPALPLFSYFIQFLRTSFLERRTYLAYDMMIVAALATMFSRVKWKNVIAIISITAFSFLGIYAFFYTSEGLRAYATAYSDMQIGFLFAGTLFMWFSSDEKSFIHYFSSLTMLALLVNCKDMCFAVALIAAGIMVADMFISGNYPSDRLTGKSRVAEKLALPGIFALISVMVFFFFKQSLGIVLFAVSLLFSAALLSFKKIRFSEKTYKIGKILLRIFFILLLFATIVFFYRVWAMHYAATHTGISRDPPLKITLLQALLGQSWYFNLILEDMTTRFFSDTFICFGSLFEMFIVFLIVPIAASFFTKNLRKILRLSAFSVLMALGFLAYYWFHAYSFAAIFPNYIELGYELDLGSLSYNRYISTYAIGWMFAVFGVLFFDIALPFFKKQWLSFTVSITTALAMVASIFYYTPHHPDQYLITSNKVFISSEYSPRSALNSRIGHFASWLTDGDCIYFLSFASDGGEWFILGYEIFPALTPQEIGLFVDPNTANPDYLDPKTGEIKSGYAGMDPKGFIEFLRENGVNFLYVSDRIDEYFMETFAPMFTDYLAQVYDGSVQLYYVEDHGGDEVRFVPIVSPSIQIPAIHAGEFVSPPLS